MLTLVYLYSNNNNNKTIKTGDSCSVMLYLLFFGCCRKINNPNSEQCRTLIFNNLFTNNNEIIYRMNIHNILFRNKKIISSKILYHKNA